MYTLRGLKNKISSLMEISNFDEKAVSVLDEIYKEREELDERIRRYAKDYSDDSEEFNEWQDSDSGEWEGKYNDLKDKYMSRFFDGDKETVLRDSDVSAVRDAEDMKRADEELEPEEQKQIDDLFEGGI